MKKRIKKIVFAVFVICIYAMAARAQIITTIAGSPAFGSVDGGEYGGPYPPVGDGGPALNASVWDPSFLCTDDAGNVYICQSQTSLIRKISPSGIISTIAGTYNPIVPWDGGIFSDSTISHPEGIAADSKGNIYIADVDNDCIRKIDTTGAFSTFAGIFGAGGFSGDGGPATSARIGAFGVAVDKIGNVYIADGANNRIRKVDTFGIITTIAGTGAMGHTGDGGPATLAEVLSPNAIATDNKGNIFISEGAIYIRKIDTTGIITTIAGTGIVDYSGDGGPATAAAIECGQVAVDTAGNIYIGGAPNSRVRKIDTAGTITTIAGTGIVGYSGDGGPAIAAQFSSPVGVALDRAGHIYIADRNNNCIRKITDTIQYANITASTGLSICYGTPVTFTAHAVDTTPYHYHWQVNGTAAGTDSATFTTATLTNGDSVKCFFLDTSGAVLDTSNTIVVLVVPLADVSVTVTPGPYDTVCAGAMVIYSVTATTGGGTAPSYTWEVNGVDMAGGYAYYYSPNDGDTITCLITSNAACAIPATVSGAPVVMTVKPLPQSGSIAGPGYVCAGDTIILSDTSSGGVWSSGITGATVTSAGLVSGTVPGAGVIGYTVVNSCGSSTAIKLITVYAQPQAGTISGPATVCADTAVSLTDSALGGIWLGANAHASLVAVYDGSIVTGVSAGTDTIFYVVTNICGADTAMHGMEVYPSPVAGIISGPSAVCVGSTDTLTDTAADGLWSVSNASAAVDAEVVAGILAGTDTVRYRVTNSCGSAVATKIITVNPLPYAGTVTGANSVCVAASTFFSDTSIGGAWSKSNAAAGIIASSVTATVTGVSPGTDTIRYIVINICGADTAYKNIIVKPLPDAGAVSGISVLCLGSTDTLADTAAGGLWSLYNTNAGIVSYTDTTVVTGITAGTDTVSYTVTNSCGIARATYALIINPLPYAGTITGITTICPGSNYFFTDNASGGIWSSSNSSIAIVNDSGMVSGIAPGTDTIHYKVTNSCGTAQEMIPVTVNLSPPAIHIVTHPDSMLCSGTLYQNFGTDIAPVAGVSYAWSAYNAGIYLMSPDHQYCLVNFESPGVAKVMLTSVLSATGCTSKDSFTAVIGNTIIPDPGVVYYGSDLVCTDNTANSYQWGFDSKATLDSALIPGALNQDYYIINPDFIDNYYWVLTKQDGCLQKSYYNAPESVGMPILYNMQMLLYPDPASTVLNVEIKGLTDIVDVEVFDMSGNEVYKGELKNGKGSVDLSGMSPGFYLIMPVKNGISLGSEIFIKK